MKHGLKGSEPAAHWTSETIEERLGEVQFLAQSLIEGLIHMCMLLTENNATKDLPPVDQKTLQDLEDDIPRAAKERAFYRAQQKLSPFTVVTFA